PQASIISPGAPGHYFTVPTSTGGPVPDCGASSR
ncbi:hypothetical protein LTSEINV_1899, partial [Salmonella enterica subsp. enterica serovar Inverness str. R8-3668]